VSRKRRVLLACAVLLLAGFFVLRSLLSVPQYVQLRPVEPAWSAGLAQDALWISLFNGENLDGWTARIAGFEPGVNAHDTYRVEDGAITVSYADYERFDNRFGHLFYNTPYSHYVLRLEYRFIGEQATDSPAMFWAWRNSGVMIHSQAPETMALEQWFPVSIEVQLLGAREGKHRSTANLCTPGTHVQLYGIEELYTPHCLDSLSRSYAGDQWVELEIEVWGADKIRHFVNGELVMEYTGPQLDPTADEAQGLLAARSGGELLLSGGYIALQSESHPVQFRNIRLHPISQRGGHSP
jgi:hypothetical protein